MNKKVNRLCKTNSEALRWIKNRFGIIAFVKIENIVYCKVTLGKREKLGFSLINAVNEWIKHFNRDL